ERSQKFSPASPPPSVPISARNSEQGFAEDGFKDLKEMERVPSDSDRSVVSRLELSKASWHLQHNLKVSDAQLVLNRLRLRLGAWNSPLVTGASLHDACSSLGLTKYTVEDMNIMLNQLAGFIDLTFENDAQERQKRQSGKQTMFGFAHIEGPEVMGKPQWRWPEESYVHPTSRASTLRKSGSMMPPELLEEQMSQKKCYNCVPTRALMEVFLAQEEAIHRRIFGARLQPQFQAMKEILLAGDTNRLVAELTFVRINDLAAPPEPMSFSLLIEPLVAVLIVANGVMIGFQTDPLYRSWPGWTYLEIMFATFLVIEVSIRMYLMGCHEFFRGQESAWNLFDMFLSCTGVVDVCVQLVRGESSDVFGTSLLRFCRLIRLVRIVKVFRLKFMKDLRLMVKGLVAGIKTLILAFTLLFTVLYVISGFATMTIGTSKQTEDLNLSVFFATIPASMFTCFRCFTGECVNDSGQPIHSILASEFGLPFIMGYVASFMLVTMGIFNVILAVYVDITMKAAKENDLVTFEQHNREAIRVARIARELLKKFAAAFRVFQDLDDTEDKQLNIKNTEACFMDGDMMEGVAITKELFLMVIQDRRVQALMDELELPPDRANLFEIIDADSSGTLQLSELVHGLLKIRGEIAKSDVVAGLLATKAVYEKVEEMLENLLDLRTQLTGLQVEMRLQKEESFTHSLPVAGQEEKDLVMPKETQSTSFLLQVPARPLEICEEDDLPMFLPSPQSRTRPV
ncbi:unnamed protein product, partial [Effrenium voratum]